MVGGGREMRAICMRQGRLNGGRQDWGEGGKMGRSEKGWQWEETIFGRLPSHLIIILLWDKHS